MKKKILIVHGLLNNSRLTNINHTASFWKHSSFDQIYYVNIFGSTQQARDYGPYDALIVTYEVLALRNLPIWPIVTKILISLSKISNKSFLMPQDDYSAGGELDSLAIKMGCIAIYTPITNDLNLIYPKSLSSGINFYEALTGYVEQELISETHIHEKKFPDRKIDLGQRVRSLPQYFGSEGTRKSLLTMRFAELAEKHNFSVDVSSSEDHMLVGESWLNFLGNIRFTISRKGGASLLDKHGNLAYSSKRIENLFPTYSNKLIPIYLRIKNPPSGNFSAVSPRLFEAASLGVCQILESDDYLGVLEPWIHYLPINSDFSNAPEVLETMKDFDRCEKIADNAKKILIQSEGFSYKKFIKEFESTQFNITGEKKYNQVQVDLDNVSVLNNSIKDSIPSNKKNRIRNEIVPIVQFGKGTLWVESLKAPWVAISKVLKSN